VLIGFLLPLLASIHTCFMSGWLKRELLCEEFMDVLEYCSSRRGASEDLAYNAYFTGLKSSLAFEIVNHSTRLSSLIM
jgi:hypothetical protein